MKLLRLALFMVVFVAISVTGSPYPVQDAELSAGAPRLPWPVSPLEWSGTINGAEVNITGNFEDIFSHLGLKYPQTPPNDDRLSSTTATSNIKYTASGEVESALVERTASGKVTNPRPLRFYEKDGSLQNHSGRHSASQLLAGTSNEPTSGPSKWSSITSQPSQESAKSRPTAARECNATTDLWFTFATTPDCNYLGTFVQDITNLCSVNRENPKVTRAGGQEFETEGYNVIVRQENCGW
ncbi:hypothetical protein DL95DRAFT_411179 [Leptodontidium sp. 2 PMI_412]|nr:hypothetical protein DL95DRAFT_411179 [Leptodontidium sp. 2 PMI_412]